jgi:hypothetical protein
MWISRETPAVKRRWPLALVLIGMLGVAVFLIIQDRNGLGPGPLTTAKNDPEEEAQLRIDMLIAELHGIHDRGNFGESIKSPRFWEIVRELEKHQAKLDKRRSPVVDRLIGFFSYLPEDKRHDADRQKLFAATVAIDPGSPDKLIELWLLQGKPSANQVASLGPAIVPALMKALAECTVEQESRQNGLAIVLGEMGQPVLAQVRATLSHANPGARLAAVKTLAELGRHGIYGRRFSG